MIRVCELLDRARGKPVLGLTVLVLLAILLALVALHPAIAALEVAASCLMILAIGISAMLVFPPRGGIAASTVGFPSRARPPTARGVSRSSQLLVPLRL